MNTCRCISQSASLTTTHRVYLAGSDQSTLKLDAIGRELAADAKTGEKSFRLRPRLGGWIANHE